MSHTAANGGLESHPATGRAGKRGYEWNDALALTRRTERKPHLGLRSAASFAVLHVGTFLLRYGREASQTVGVKSHRVLSKAHCKHTSDY